MLMSPMTWAYDFAVDGICYNLNEDGKTVSVTHPDNEYYKGELLIPTDVAYNGQKYAVTLIEKDAFHLGASITGIEIKAQLTSLALNLSECAGLKELKLYSKDPSLCGKFMFDEDIVKSVTLYVPEGCVAAYFAYYFHVGPPDLYAPTYPWKSFGHVREFSIPVERLFFLSSSINLGIGESAKLTPAVSPSNHTETITWSSINPDVAVVDDKGIITAMAEGWTKIYAAAGSKSDFIYVYVSAIEVESVELDKHELTLPVNYMYQLVPTITPPNATDQSIWWLSSDESVATVDANGYVIAVSAGSCEIYARAHNAIIATCSVTVPPVLAESIQLYGGKEPLKIGETSRISAWIWPENCSDKTLVWTSSNPDVATVDQEGVVTGVFPGKTDIYAVCGNCKSNVVTVTVDYAEPTDILPPDDNETVFANGIELYKGEPTLIAFRVVPESAFPELKWGSDNTDVIRILEDGSLLGLKVGETTITVRAGNITKKFKAKVVERVIPPTAITLDTHKLTLQKGEQTDIECIVTPSNANGYRITLRSNDTGVVKTSYNTIIAIAPGTAIVTATCGELSDSCIVTVTPIPVKSISLNHTFLELAKGQSQTLSGSVCPYNADIDQLQWSSSDENVALVDKNGVVTAIREGEADITVSCQGVSDKCTVRVRQSNSVETVVLNRDTIELGIGMTEALVASVYPENANWYAIIWESENPEIASVNPEGVIYGKSEGETVVTAQCNGVYAKCVVNVIPKANTIFLLPDYEIELGYLLAVHAILQPADAYKLPVSWTSLNDSVATVWPDANDSSWGIIQANGCGETTIIATCDGLTASCQVLVYSLSYEEESISTDCDDFDLEIGETYTLTVNFFLNRNNPAYYNPILQYDDGIIEVTQLDRTDVESFSGYTIRYAVKGLQPGQSWLLINPGFDASAHALITVKSSQNTIEEVEGLKMTTAGDYYNLQGIRVATENLTPGIYFRRVGSSVEKVIRK